MVMWADRVDEKSKCCCARRLPAAGAVFPGDESVIVRLNTQSQAEYHGLGGVTAHIHAAPGSAGWMLLGNGFADYDARDGETVT